MRINHNISAMNAHRLLNVNNSFASKSLEKLSSGKRINRAGDDAAGMAITEKMRAQINGLKMASRNSLDGVSLVQTAEGAMGEVHSMLQRMRELSVQAANGTAADSDRQAIQDEIDQLTSEVNRIANGTEYNTRNILMGNEDPDSNTVVHRMSTGRSAQYIGGEDLKLLTVGDFDFASEQLSIFVDGEEKVVNLTQTDGTTTLDNFMELVNDALGDSAEAILNKDGKMEITTSSIGGRSEVNISGSTNILDKIFNIEPATVTGGVYNTATNFTGASDIKLNDKTVNLTNVAALGDGGSTPVSIDDAIIALQKDIDAVGDLKGKFKVGKDITGTKIEIKTAEMGATSELKVADGSSGELAMLGLTDNSGSPAKGVGTSKSIGTAESATQYSSGSFYFDEIPEIGSTIKIGNETVEFFDSSVAPYVGSNRPIDISGKNNPEEVVDEIVNKLGSGIEGITLKKDPSISGSKSDYAGRLLVEYNNTGFDGNLIHLEGSSDNFMTSLQVGPNTGQSFRLEVGDIRAMNLKISADNPTRNPGVKGAAYRQVQSVTNGITPNKVEYSLDVLSEETASAAIEVFDNAIVQIASERSKLGATQNRLEHTIANLDNTSENLTAAMSRIEDTDMALEMANYQKLNVLQQAGVSMLAQANQQPQSILKLLG